MCTNTKTKCIIKTCNYRKSNTFIAPIRIQNKKWTRWVPLTRLIRLTESNVYRITKKNPIKTKSYVSIDHNKTKSIGLYTEKKFVYHMNKRILLTTFFDTTYFFIDVELIIYQLIINVINNRKYVFTNKIICLDQF